MRNRHKVNRVPDSGWDTTAEPEYLVLPEPRPSTGREMVDRREPVLEAVLMRLETLERVVDRLASQVGQSHDEIGASIVALGESVKGVSESVGSVRADGAFLAGSVGEVRRDVTALRTALEETHEALTRTVGDASTELTTGLREAARAVEATVKDAAQTTAEEHTSTMDRYSREFTTALRPLAEGLARMDRLAGLIQSMSKRRGFQELVRSEKALRDEQSSFVRSLSESSAGVSATVAALTQQIAGLEERLDRAAEDISSLKQLPVQATERVARAVERLRTELSLVLQERFGEQVTVSIDRLKTELEAGMPAADALEQLRDFGRTQAEITLVQKGIDGAMASLRSEVRSLTERIQTWGKPKTAPRLGQEVDALGSRLAALEEEIQDGLAQRLAAEVTRQVVATLQATDPEQRRGRFRR